MTEIHQSAADRSASVWATGAAAGIIGAVVYTLFIEGVTLAEQGSGALVFPFRQIGAVVLGPSALADSYSPIAAVAAGTLIHFAIAIAFGVALAAIASRFSLKRVSTLVVIGTVAGLAFYALNVFVIFPTAFPWFLTNSRLVQSLGHALFGAITAAWLAR